LWGVLSDYFSQPCQRMVLASPFTVIQNGGGDFPAWSKILGNGSDDETFP